MPWTLLNMKQEGSAITNNILILDLIKFTGNKKISMWTKQTFRQPPFSLVNYIDWTEQPTKAVPLKNIFTAPSYRRKYRKAHGLKKERLDDIFEIFTKEQLNTDNPARILLQGNLHNILKIHCLLSKLLFF